MTDEAQDTTGTEAPAGGKPSKDACTMAMLAHLLGIVTSFVGPLIIWMIKKDDDAFINDQSKEALNFQITVFIFYAALVALSCVTLGFAAVITVPLMFAVGIAALILAIMACIKANDGVTHRYPFTLRLIK